MTKPKHSNTKIKARNFLTNLSYQRLNKNNHLDISLVIDSYSFLTKNVNPFSLERTFSSVNDQQYVYMLWEKCIPNEFYKLVCKNNNFISLSQLNVLT